MRLLVEEDRGDAVEGGVEQVYESDRRVFHLAKGLTGVRGVALLRIIVGPPVAVEVAHIVRIRPVPIAVVRPGWSVVRVVGHRLRAIQ